MPICTCTDPASPARARRLFLPLPLGCVWQMRNNPYGHDAKHMASAMGAHWGSNIDRAAKAKVQAKKVDTSTPDDDPDSDYEFTVM